MQACRDMLPHGGQRRGQQLVTVILMSDMGALAQAELYTAADAETMELPDKEDGAAQAKEDPFARLEKGVEDRRRGREGAERIAELREDSNAKYRDDYTINRALRRQLRCGIPAADVSPSSAGFAGGESTRSLESVTLWHKLRSWASRASSRCLKACEIACLKYHVLFLRGGSHMPVVCMLLLSSGIHSDALVQDYQESREGAQ